MICRIENQSLSARINTHGGYIESLINRKTGKEHIWQYDPAYWPRRTSVCFPIMSILKNDETVMEGRTWHMENHGFLREMNLEVFDAGVDFVTLRAVSDDFTKQHYPYDFCFDLTYRLEESTLSVQFEVSDTGRIPMHYCLGVHTTYRVPLQEGEDMQEDLILRFPHRESASVHVVQGGLQTHEMKPCLEDTDVLALKGAFEDGALIFDTQELTSRRVTLCSRKSGFETEVDFDGWNHIAFWTKPGNMPFLCIEPMTALADYEDTDGQFTSKPNLITLLPGDSRRHVYRINVR